MEEKKNLFQTNLIATLYNTFASSIKSRITFEDLKPESMKGKGFSNITWKFIYKNEKRKTV